MATWADLNKRQQEYLKAIYETDQEQEEFEHGQWNRGGRPRPASEWRWMEYGIFETSSTLYMKLYLRKLIDEGTGSTFNALEKRGLIKCKYTTIRRNGYMETIEPFLMIQMTKEGRKLVRTATGEQREKALPTGTLREWHWKAMAMAWKDRSEGVMAHGGWYGDYGKIGWKTWLRLRDYKAGALVEEYTTTGDYSRASGMTLDNHWIKLTLLGEQYYRENWARYRELYPDVDAPEPTEE